MGIICQNLYPDLYQLKDENDCYAFLFIGTKEALLFDTMSGVSDVRKAVRSLTDLPVTVVLSHTHYDHIGGCVSFSHVYLSAEEQSRFSKNLSYLAGIFPTPGILKLSTSSADSLPEFRDLKEGICFDLGSVQLKTVSLPGHTPGSMGLLCEKYRILFSGDAVTPIMCLFFPESLEIPEYMNTIRKIMTLPADYYMTSHHSRLFPVSELSDYLACAEFSQNDRGMKFQHDRIPDLKGRLHIYRGDNPDADDFLGLICK